MKGLQMSTGRNTSTSLIDFNKEKAILFMRRANSLLKDKQKEIKKDPMPLVQSLQEENYELNLLLAEIKLLVNPIYIDWTSEEPIKAKDIGPDAKDRLLIIREVLESWQFN